MLSNLFFFLSPIRSVAVVLLCCRCIVAVFSLCCRCVVVVLSLCCRCVIAVLSLCCCCVIAVLSLCCCCVVVVLLLCYWCVVAVSSFSPTFLLHELICNTFPWRQIAPEHAWSVNFHVSFSVFILFLCSRLLHCIPPRLLLRNVKYCPTGEH